MKQIKARDNKDLNVTEFTGELPYLVHYGHNTFSKEMFKPIKNAAWVKPEGGLWTSPIDSEFGWYHWATEEQFEIHRLETWFCLGMIQGSKILLIDSYEDFIRLPFCTGNTYFQSLDFELIAEYYDAIWLTNKGQAETRHPRPIMQEGHCMPPNLYGWDFDTVLILNPDCVVELRSTPKHILPHEQMQLPQQCRTQLVLEKDILEF